MAHYLKIFLSTLLIWISNGLFSQEMLVLTNNESNKHVSFDPDKKITVYYENENGTQSIRGIYNFIDSVNIRIVTDKHGAMTLPFSRIIQIGNYKLEDYPLIEFRDPNELYMNVERFKNSVTIGIAGDGSLISLNYDKLYKINDKVLLDGRIGIGYNEQFTIWGTPYRYLTIPHHFTINFCGANQLNRAANHLFEIGLGGTLILGSIEHHYAFYPKLGYRFSPVHSKKITFRLQANIPVLFNRWYDFALWSDHEMVFLPIGISLGYLFK